MKFRKVSDNYNWLGWEVIEIVEFDYDGKGSALALCDGVLQPMCDECLDLLTIGHDGFRAYVANIENRKAFNKQNAICAKALAEWEEAQPKKRKKKAA